MDFRPINDDHSIASVSFGLFSTEFIGTEAIQRLVSSRDAIRSDLPAVSVPDSDMPSIEFAYRRPDGSASWSLRCGNGNEIVVECQRYTRWVKVWETARSLLIYAIEKIGGQGNVTFQNPTLRVVDRFREDTSEAHVRNLLKNSTLIANVAFDAGQIFHSNVGWFDECDGASLLNTLNVQGRRDPIFKPSQAQAVHTLFVSVDHFQQYRSDEFIDFHSDQDIVSTSLDRIMSLMHNRNKSLLNGVLVNEMQERIGLMGGE